ncbi:MAG: hypothetical protein FWE33_00750 [Defluviitaleaceae bacterium]|nr:hypothetical protein [Defluviitaleaceae bacterium]
MVTLKLETESDDEISLARQVCKETVSMVFLGEYFDYKEELPYEEIN